MQRRNSVTSWINAVFPLGLNDPAMKTDLRYFRTSLQKKFPEHTAVQIDTAIERALEEMKPSRDRTLLNRRVVAILSNKGEGRAAG